MKITCSRGELSDCLHALRSAPVDVVLLTDGSNDHEGLIDTLRLLHASHPNINLILLLDSYDRDLVVNAMRAGARGLFCRARESFLALCQCISAICQGQFWLNAEQMGFVIAAVGSTNPARVINATRKGLLTPREAQVVSLVAEGIGNRGIARQLDIKEHTVKKSLVRIYDKLGVSNRVELVLYELAQRGPEGISAPSKPPLQSNLHRTECSYPQRSSLNNSKNPPGALGRRGTARNSSFA